MMRSRAKSSIRTLGAIAVLVGCSSEDVQSGAVDAGPDTGTEAGPDTGTEAGIQCNQGADYVGVALQPAPPVAPGQLSSIDWEASGRIAEKAGVNFTLDTCHPDTDCVPTLTTVTFQGGTLPDIDWPVGAYVTLRYEAKVWGPGNTVATLSVRNLPEWAGAPNPVSASEQWYLLATEGYLEHPQAPFEVEQKGVEGCPLDYSMRARAPGADWIELVQGESGSVLVDAWRYDITVVRSFAQSGYDRPPPFAWWATSAASQ